MLCLSWPLKRAQSGPSAWFRYRCPGLPGSLGASGSRSGSRFAPGRTSHQILHLSVTFSAKISHTGGCPPHSYLLKNKKVAFKTKASWRNNSGCRALRIWKWNCSRHCMRPPDLHATPLPAPTAPVGVNVHCETESRLVWNDQEHVHEEHEFVYEVSWVPELGAWRRFLRTHRKA